MTISLVQTGVQFPTGIQTTAAQNVNTFPVGGIILWSGGSIPGGWALCDGNNGTPNLIDRFPVQAGGSYAFGTAGGSNTIGWAQMASHAHNVSASASISGQTSVDGYHSHGVADPGHSHLVSTRDNGGVQGNPAWYAANYPAGIQANTSVVSAGVGIQAGGTHTHPIAGGTVSLSGDTQATGSGAEFLPPFYALYYIMRIA